MSYHYIVAGTVPVLPFGWKMVCFEDPADRQKQAFHRVEGFVLGMCTHQHRKIQGIIRLTNAVRETNTFTFFAPPQLVSSLHPNEPLFLEPCSSSLFNHVLGPLWRIEYPPERNGDFPALC